MQKKKICFIVAMPGTARSFLRDHMTALHEDYEIYFVANIKSEEDLNLLTVDGYNSVEINRKISLWSDLKSVFQLALYFRKMKFDAVHSLTPKAGLVTSLAGLIARVPIRIHIFTGQVWATRKGFMRWMLKKLDTITSALDTHILVDGESQRQYIINNGVVSDYKSGVLAHGSICGVNTDRFTPSVETRVKARNELCISDDKVVFIFMGRLNRDKGMYELLPAFNRLVEKYPNAFLLMFGRDEENIASTFSQYNNLSKDNFLYYGSTTEAQKMLQAGDVFVLPTYREGFGTSVIESACLGLPTITSDAYGVCDASVPYETGLRCKVGDIETLYNCMEELLTDKDKRERFGKAGRERILKQFKGAVVVEAWKEFYHNLLG